MAKCKECDYPFATNGKCSNCGSENPTGSASSIFGVAIVVIVIMGLIKGTGGSSSSVKTETSISTPTLTIDTLNPIENTQSASSYSSNDAETVSSSEPIPQTAEPSDTIVLPIKEVIKSEDVTPIQKEEIIDTLPPLQ